MLANDQYTNMSWSICETMLLLIGGVLLNRAITNRPIFQDAPANRQMLANAREKWSLGGLAVILYFLAFILEFLGSHGNLEYAEIHPRLLLVSILVLSISASYVFWRYVRFIKYGKKFRKSGPRVST